MKLWPDKPGRRKNSYDIPALHDRVLVRRMEGVATSRRRIISPDTAEETDRKGEVVVVGQDLHAKGSELPALNVAAGDIIRFDKRSGIEVKINGEILMMLKKADILRIVERAVAVEEAA